MPPKKNLNELTQKQKIEQIRLSSPQVLECINKDISDLSDFELNTLVQFSETEQASKSYYETLTNNIVEFSSFFPIKIDEELKKLKLSDKEKSLIDSNIKTFLVVGVSKVSSKIFENTQAGTGILYSAVLCERTLGILESILNFKKEIDKTFPGFTDQIVAITAPAIVGLVSIYYPPAGLILKSTGVLTAVSNLLTTKNLDIVVNKMQTDLKQMELDKNLKELQQTGIKISEISNMLSVSPSTLIKFNFSLDAAQETIKELNQNPSAKIFLQEVAKYAKDYVPSTKSEIDNKLNSIQSQTIKELKTKGVPDNIVNDIQEILEKNMKVAKIEMNKALNQEIAIFDKIGYVIKTSKSLEKATDEMNLLAKKNISYASTIQSVTKQFSTKIEQQVTGNTTNIANKMTTDSKAKQFAKKTLGVKISTEILVKRAATQHKNINMTR